MGHNQSMGERPELCSDTAVPATPAKAPGEGDASSKTKSFPLQFGSISPVFMNGKQQQVMRKAEKKCEVGKVTDEEEEAKQRQFKAILNKLTPQNFGKLFEQIKAVNIDNANTLTGVVSQIFDKALMEPTFCEMYANFCYHLARELPDFSEDNEKITFMRLLLNKCQEEFERGEREQEEADRADQEGEVKQSEEEREQKRIQVRRRMLGNIRLIGELYKKKMLTERIMHECINKLLGQYQNPDEEDIEALCTLMSTIGEMIDHPKAKEHMDAYFDMMVKLSNNMKLPSRVRFMLKDSIDLRKNKWQQRRKVEGLFKYEGEGTEEDINAAGLISLPAAGSRDKHVLLELSRSNSTMTKEKKKRKKNLQKKTNSAGTTSDLDMAYKDPEGKKKTVFLWVIKKETVASSSESLAGTSSINSKQVLVDVKDDVVLSENGGQSKVLEPDDWEDATDISTPKLDTTVDDGKLAHGGLKHVGEDGNGVMAKKYSRDFLLKFREQCTSLH